MKKLMCFDIDGTIRDTYEHKVSASTLKALNELKENGYKIIVSTGRGYDSFMRMDIKDIVQWDGFVLNNGQAIFDKDLHLIQEKFIDSSLVEECLRVANKEEISVMVKTNPRFLVGKKDKNVETFLNYFSNPMPRIGTYRGEDVAAMVVLGDLDYDYKPFKMIKGLSVMKGESTYADVTRNDLSKATGIKVLMDYYNSDGYYAFGDSLNDEEMFKYSDCSICMGQGNEDLKKKATFVTKSIDEDGIEYAVHLILEGKL